MKSSASMVVNGTLHRDGDECIVGCLTSRKLTAPEECFPQMKKLTRKLVPNTMLG